MCDIITRLVCDNAFFKIKNFAADRSCFVLSHGETNRFSKIARERKFTCRLLSPKQRMPRIFVTTLQKKATRSTRYSQNKLQRAKLCILEKKRRIKYDDDNNNNTSNINILLSDTRCDEESDKHSSIFISSLLREEND